MVAQINGRMSLFTDISLRNEGQDAFEPKAVTMITEINRVPSEANTMATEMNTVATEVNGNALMALGAGNYKGNWSSLTGPAEIGWGVSKVDGAGVDQFYRASIDMADITAYEPGVDAEWVLAIFPVVVVASITKSARTNNTALGVGDQGNLITATGTFTQTFATDLSAGWWCDYKNAGDGDITFDPGTMTIDGLSSFISYPGEKRRIIYDGSNLFSYVQNSFYKKFISTDNFIVPPGYTQHGADVIGAGSGGRYGVYQYTGGGSGGGRYKTLVRGLVPGDIILATIGAGGGNMGNGGDSSLGDHAIATGGKISSSGTGIRGGCGMVIHYPGADAVASSYQGSTSGPAEWGGALASYGSLFGGPGGGNGGTYNGSSQYPGGVGGSCGNMSSGGGGAGGAVGQPGSPGADGVGELCGDGGGGGAGVVTGKGYAGGDGGAPGGGGGGPGSGSTGTGASGHGGRGEVRVWGVI